MSSVEDLTTPLAVDEIKSAIYAVISRTGATTTNWKPGAVMRTFITAVAIVLCGLSQLGALLARSAFLPLSSGEWLRLVAFYVYNVIRIEASFATGKLTLINGGGGNFSAAAGAFTARNPTTRQLYTNINPILLLGGATLVIDIASLEVGAQATSYGGEISELITAWTAVTCTNANPVVGNDRETDQSLRQRCLDKLGSLSPNGPSDAYRYIAKSALRSDGSSIGITRVRAKPDGHGTVNVFVGGLGSIPGVINDITTDLGIVYEQLWRLCVPLGVNMTLASAVPRGIDATYTVWLYNTSGFSDQQVKDIIEANLVSFLATVPIGGNSLDGSAGYIYRNELISVIGRSQQLPTGSILPTIRVELSYPTIDTLINANEVTILGAVNGTVNQIAAVGS